MNYLAILFLIFFLLFTKTNATVNITLNDPDPNYGNLQTVARLKLADGPNAACYRDYRGLEVMIETRENGHPERIAWAGKVTFRPEGNDVSAVYVLESEVIINYIARPNYFTVPRNYGTIPAPNNSVQDPAGAALVDPRLPRRIYANPCTFNNVSTGRNTSHYKDWMHDNALFEWTLNNTYTINDLIAAVDSLRIGNRFPKYLVYGYSSDGECLNCVTFSIALLQRLGVDLVGNSPFINSYLASYLQKTWWGLTTQVLKGGTGLAGAAVGGVAGWVAVEQAIEKGAIAGGILGGPIGCGIGAVAGVVVVGGVAYFGIGKIEKGVLDRQSNIRHAATPERFCKEIFDQRNVLNLRIVETKISNIGIIPTTFANTNVELLRMLNEARSWKLFTNTLVNLPAGCNFSQYDFNY